MWYNRNEKRQGTFDNVSSNKKGSRSPPVHNSYQYSDKNKLVAGYYQDNKLLDESP